MVFSLYDQLQGLSLMVADVGVVVVKFDGLSVGAADGWHSSQPSLTCDDDGVATVDFGVLQRLQWLPEVLQNVDQAMEQVWQVLSKGNVFESSSAIVAWISHGSG
jgi:hypothetical protein